MIDQVTSYRKIFEGKKSLDEVGVLLNKGWIMKKSLSKKNISNNKLDKIYNISKKKRCFRRKNLWCRRRRFYAALCKKKNHLRIKNSLKHLPFYDFDFDLSGSRITYYDERV